MIEAREREERERSEVEHSEALRVGQAREEPLGRVKPPSSSSEEPKVEDPWEKARKEAPPEQPASWTPSAARRRV